jgi:hypothetical protein
MLGEIRDDRVRTPRERAVAATNQWAGVAETRPRAGGDGVARHVQRAGGQDTEERIGVRDEDALPHLHASVLPWANARLIEIDQRSSLRR